MSPVDAVSGNTMDGALTAPELIELRGYVTASRFLFREAELLDANQLEEWLTLLSEDLRYFMPVRTTVLRADLDAGVSSELGHFDETFASMATRVQKAQLPSSFAEDPPSRTRRYVTNIQATVSEAFDEIHVSSSLLLVRNRWDDPTNEVVTASRRDVLVRHGEDRWKLQRREIVPDQVTIGTVNLGIFL